MPRSTADDRPGRSPLEAAEFELLMHPSWPEIMQAAGMMTVHNTCTMHDALLLLQQQAVAEGRSLDVVAFDVLDAADAARAHRHAQQDNLESLG